MLSGTSVARHVIIVGETAAMAISKIVINAFIAGAKLTNFIGTGNFPLNKAGTHIHANSLLIKRKFSIISKIVQIPRICPWEIVQIATGSHDP